MALPSRGLDGRGSHDLVAAPLIFVIQSENATLAVTVMAASAKQQKDEYLGTWKRDRMGNRMCSIDELGVRGENNHQPVRKLTSNSKTENRKKLRIA
jgi:hypothetical protein